MPESVALPSSFNSMTAKSSVMIYGSDEPINKDASSPTAKVSVVFEGLSEEPSSDGSYIVTVTDTNLYVPTGEVSSSEEGLPPLVCESETPPEEVTESDAETEDDGVSESEFFEDESSEVVPPHAEKQNNPADTASVDIKIAARLNFFIVFLL